MIALVTGGGRGIGRAISLRFASAGWTVAISARSAPELAETARLSGRPVLAIPTDMADPAAIHAMVAQVEQTLGPVDLLVNNAGTGGPFGPIWEVDPADWWRCQEVNLRGPMLCCREVLPGMVQRRSGRIINMASGAGTRPFLGLGSYVVSKTALIRFSEQLAWELEPHGVAVFPVRPGIVRTAMVEEARHHVTEIQQSLDAGRDVTPEAVADLILALASGRADALSGRLISIGDDIDALARDASEIRAQDLRLLRARA